MQEGTGVLSWSVTMTAAMRRFVSNSLALFPKMCLLAITTLACNQVAVQQLPAFTAPQYSGAAHLLSHLHLLLGLLRPIEHDSAAHQPLCTYKKSFGWILMSRIQTVSKCILLPSCVRQIRLSSHVSQDLQQTGPTQRKSALSKRL